eukprot:CAMPEP_0196725590 /NCGR_PEP_ID=MMETSP1091-20130531/7100_1 /TAXON_ID=302021 /ORGANISM="Rhodomonas sp., Strain CCMP768" /LENGTH=181 /DNA_ID=CAMNT_0042067889 /DNA_START=1 /DNA_END=547 /DNA_ORIENTATION=-
MGITTQETFPVESFVLEQIGQLLLQAGRYSLAATALQRALNSSRAPSLLILLARTNIQDNDLPAAVQNYMQVVEDYSNEAPTNAVKRDCLEQLVALSTKLKRNTEVAKFQSMLKKLLREQATHQHHWLAVTVAKRTDDAWVLKAKADTARNATFTGRYGALKPEWHNDQRNEAIVPLSPSQ